MTPIPIDSAAQGGLRVAVLVQVFKTVFSVHLRGTVRAGKGGCRPHLCSGSFLI